MTFMGGGSHLGSINPNRAGVPNGGRPDSDDDDLLKNYRDRKYTGTAPWVGTVETCEKCPRTANGCKEHSLGVPRVRVSGGPGAGDSLPCQGEWELYDTEEVTAEHVALCGGCSFSAWCLENATKNAEQLIWAATNAEDRKVLRSSSDHERKAA